MAGQGPGGVREHGGHRALSDLLWLQWGWQMEAGLEGERMTSQILRSPGSPARVDCSLLCPLARGLGLCSEFQELPFCGALPLCQALCSGFFT